MTERTTAGGGRRLRAALAAASLTGVALVVLGVLALSGTAQVVVCLSGVIVFAVVGTGLLVAADRRAMEKRLTRRLDAIQTTLGTHRQSQSRHEYRHTQALTHLTGLAETARGDLEGLVWHQYASPAEPSAPPAARPRVLFVTSNGDGMGHLSRCSAIALAGADRLDATILTLSSAAQKVKEAGLPVIHFPGRHQDESWTSWHRRFSRHLSDHLRRYPKDVVVFDGVWIFRSLTESTRRLDIPLVWLSRGTWKEGADRTQLHRAGEYCDAVIHPADLSPHPDVARGIRSVEQVGPIVLPHAREPLDRETACTALGLDAGRRFVLVQLGSGTLSDLASRTAEAVRAVHARGPQWDAVVVKYPFGYNPTENAERVHTVSVYPLATYLRAFDACVITAGYNSVHECLAAGLPPVIWPLPDALTDDQVRRATGVAANGMAVVVHEGAEIGAALGTVTEPAFVNRAQARAEAYFARDGAQEAVDALTGLVAGRHAEPR